MQLKALFNHTDVEKIKVIGSTYMAACGLEVQDTGRLSATSMVPSDNEYVIIISILSILINAIGNTLY